MTSAEARSVSKLLKHIVPHRVTTLQTMRNSKTIL